jgi:hypothetical protein
VLEQNEAVIKIVYLNQFDIGGGENNEYAINDENVVHSQKL